jgi:hypothetical protein
MEVCTPTSRAERRADAAVEGNARLTAANASVLLASGVALLFVRGSDLSLPFKMRKASFILWFGTMAVHVLGPWSAVSGQ